MGWLRSLRFWLHTRQEEEFDSGRNLILVRCLDSTKMDRDPNMNAKVSRIGSHRAIGWVGSVLCCLATTLAAQEGSGPRPAARIDHALFDGLLRAYVNDDGMVNYRAWKKSDTRTLGRYLARLGGIKVETLSRSEKLAFWINAYNALTLQGILDFYPLKSIRDKVSRVGGYSIWDDYKLLVRGEDYSLNQIEHEILRKMGEPRIHLAIVCASIGCPRLLAEAYTSEKLEEQLHRNGVDFFSRAQNFRKDKKTVRLSSILKWFGEDFGGTDAAKLAFAAEHVTDSALAAQLTGGGIKVKYLAYDWSLNEQ